MRFGQDGPKASWKGSDRVALAANGPLFLAGDSNWPPGADLRVPSVRAKLEATRRTPMKLYNSLGPNPRLVRMFLLEKGIEVPAEELG